MKRLIPIFLLAAVLLIILPTTAQQNNIYYTLRAARVRSCASTFCTRLGSIPGNTRIQVAGSVEGKKWNGSTLWYQITFDGQTGYVHSSLLTTLEPGRLITPGAPTLAPVPIQSYLIGPPLILTSVPLPTDVFAATSLPPSSSRYTCNGINDLNCDAFANQREANAHLALCGYDEDRLDGDNDGLACETLPP